MDVPTVNVPALLVQLPETVIVLDPAVRVPFVPMVTEPAVTARFEVVNPTVVRVSVMLRAPPRRRPLVAIV